MAHGGSSRHDRPHVGRDHELAQVVTAVSAPDGRGLIVAGVAGVGKSHLLEMASSSLAVEGWAPLRARGDPARDTPFGSMGQLLPPLTGDPTRGAVVLRRGLDHLVEMAAPRRPLLVADDLHAFDAASATLVQQAVMDGRVRLIGTLRTGEAGVPDAVTVLWKQELVDRLDLVPFTRAEADDLVEQLMGGPVDVATRAGLWQAAAGNPLLITELVAHSRDQGSWRRNAGLWHLTHDPAVPLRSPTVAAILARRMAGAPDAVADVVDALALAGHLPLAVLDELVGHAALAQAERLRMTRASDAVDEDDGAGEPVLMLDHPLYGELRRAELGPQRTVELQRRLLAAFEQLDTVASSDVALLGRWCVETGRTGERAADLLVRAAEVAWSVNDPRAAATLARRARALRPTDDRSGLVLVNAVARLGRADELRTVADEVARTASSDAVRAEAVGNHALFLFQFANRPDAAEALLAEGAASIAEPRWRRALIKQIAVFRLQRGDLAGAEALAGPMLEAEDPATAADAAAVISPVRLMQGRVREAVELAERGMALTASLGDEVLDVLALGEYLFHQIGGWVEGERLVEADQLAQDAIAALDDDVDPFSRSFVALQVGRISRLRGRPETAARWFREAAAGFDAVHRIGFVAWSLAGLAMVQAQIGDQAGALDSAGRCQAQRDHPIRLADGEVARCLAWALVVSGQREVAADALEAAARRSLAAGEVVHAGHAFHDLVRLGHARRADESLRALAARSDSTLMAVFAQHAAATMAGRADALEEVARRFMSLGCDLHAAEAWSQLAALARDEGETRRAAVALRRAGDCTRLCEGARTPLLAPATNVGDLSRREREIAHLAGAGMRRREIAEQLVISPRTVDSHLQRIYRKLGVDNRRDLVVAITDQPST